MIFRQPFQPRTYNDRIPNRADHRGPGVDCAGDFDGLKALLAATLGAV